jgi:hypothetical protein
MPSNRVSGSLTLIVLAFLLFGCTSQAEELPKPPTPAAHEIPPSVSAPLHRDQTPASSSIGPEATTLASKAVNAFCHPNSDRETWIEGLYPFLSQSAAAAYETVNPAKVPCSKVIGEARVRDDDGSFTVRAIVPADGGDYSVYVHRPHLTDQWLVEQITPMASE